MTDNSNINPKACPLCGGDNSCAMASDSANVSQCWCMTASISPEALERVPDELINQACLCQACAVEVDKAGT